MIWIHLLSNVKWSDEHTHHERLHFFIIVLFTFVDISAVIDTHFSVQTPISTFSIISQSQLRFSLLFVICIVQHNLTRITIEMLFEIYIYIYICESNPIRTPTFKIHESSSINVNKRWNRKMSHSNVSNPIDIIKTKIIPSFDMERDFMPMSELIQGSAQCSIKYLLSFYFLSLTLTHSLSGRIVCFSEYYFHNFQLNFAPLKFDFIYIFIISTDNNKQKQKFMESRWYFIW